MSNSWMYYKIWIPHSTLATIHQRCFLAFALQPTKYPQDCFSRSAHRLYIGMMSQMSSCTQHHMLIWNCIWRWFPLTAYWHKTSPKADQSKNVSICFFKTPYRPNPSSAVDLLHQNSCRLIGFDWLTTADWLPGWGGGGGAALLFDMEQEQNVSMISGAEVTWSSIFPIPGLLFLSVRHCGLHVIRPGCPDQPTKFQFLLLLLFCFFLHLMWVDVPKDK